LIRRRFAHPQHFGPRSLDRPLTEDVLFDRVQFFLFAAAGIVAGGCVAVQQALNATLRSELGSAFWAAFISYTAGTLTLLLVLLVIREPWLALSTIAKSSPPSWVGGVFGTTYIVASIMLLPRFGAVTVVALLIAGQMLASVAFDHFGLFGLTQRPIDMYRAAGAVLLILSVLLVRT
jgi:bacterial/archaeal transporter family-2 protein